MKVLTLFVDVGGLSPADDESWGWDLGALLPAIAASGHVSGERHMQRLLTHTSLQYEDLLQLQERDVTQVKVRQPTWVPPQAPLLCPPWYFALRVTNVFWRVSCRPQCRGSGFCDNIFWFL